jgi:hypothetical protein
MARAVSRSNVAFLINKRVTANYFASCNNISSYAGLMISKKQASTRAAACGPFK